MGFVKSPAEIARLERAMAQRRFLGARSIALEVEADAERLRQLVPPPLELGEPKLAIGASVFEGGGTVGRFASASVTIPVRHAEGPGSWLLTSFYSTDSPVLFGLYTEGAVKKQAQVALSRTGDRVVATVDRHDTRLIELEAEIAEDLEPTDVRARTYCLVVHFAPSGRGLLDDPILTASESVRRTRRRQRGTGAVTLRSTPHDPLGDLPVGRVLSANYSEGDHESTCREVARIPAALAAPYAYARMDDWAAMADAGIPSGGRR